MRFGDCLHLLAAKYGRTRSQVVASLAEQGIDRTLVYRWFRNERVPGLGSGHCERIAKSLHLSREDYDLLVRSQIESLRGKANTQLNSNEVAAKSFYAEALTGSLPPRSNGRGTASGGPTGSTCPTSIVGEAAMLETATAILQSLSEPTPAAQVILFSSQSSVSADLSAAGRRDWLAAIRGAMDKGFDFVHLLRVDPDARQAELAAEYWLALAGTTGRYMPFYFSRYGVEPPSYDLLIVPGTAAVLSFATTRRDRLDAALVLNDPDQMELLRAHFAVLQSQTRPLFTASWDAGKAIERMDAAARLEGKIGDLFFSSWGLSIRTQPYDWWARHHGGETRPYDGDESLLELGRLRLDSFYQQVESHRVLEICPRSAVLRMVKTGEGALESPRGARTSQELIQLLENLLALINSFDNYELALPTEAEEKELVPGIGCTIKWDLTGDHTVHLESLPVHGRHRRPHSGVEIREPTVAAAFRRRFLDLFEHRISPLSRDKREITLFLESQIQWLRRRAEP